MQVFGCTILFAVVIINWCLSTYGQPVDYDTVKYLEDYGYAERSDKNSALRTEEYLREAISKFQEFAGLQVTGKIDDETRDLMKQPRCGVKDVNRASHREKRFIIQGSRWKVRNITYRISKFGKRMKIADIEREIREAFNVWSEQSDLKFHQVDSSTPAHIDIRFERGHHGDGDPFDGAGGTLAHAYFPVFGGDAHFDDDEKWSMSPFKGTHFLQVAAHEFGHSLGLSHSENRRALMAPFYKTNQYRVELHDDDIRGIQKLYGKKRKHDIDKNDQFDADFDYDEANFGTGNSIDGAENICENSKIDTIFTSNDQKTYIFRGDKYYELSRTRALSLKPKSISSKWPHLPANIDAAFTYANKTFFFKGPHYWKYANYRLDGNYPQKISSTFAGVPNDVDTAMVWSGNQKIYFFKGSKFWKYDPVKIPHVPLEYPKHISNWFGVPYPLDAAFQYTNKHTYFFKDDGYYRFDDIAFEVDKGDPEFPRSTAYWWIGCKNAIRGTIKEKSAEANHARPPINSRARWFLYNLLSNTDAQVANNSTYPNNVHESFFDSDVSLHQDFGEYEP